MKQLLKWLVGDMLTSPIFWVVVSLGGTGFGVKQCHRANSEEEKRLVVEVQTDSLKRVTGLLKSEKDSAFNYAKTIRFLYDKEIQNDRKRAYSKPYRDVRAENDSLLSNP
ncbi:hypothetical protein GCM10028807_63120 [Spirosoma daeguense]